MRRSLEFNLESQNVGIFLEGPQSIQRKWSLINEMEREGVAQRPTDAVEKLGYGWAKALADNVVIVTTEKAFLLGSTLGPQPIPSQEVCQIWPWTLSEYGLYWTPSILLTSYLAIWGSSACPHPAHICVPSQLDPWPSHSESSTSITSYTWPRHQPGFFLALFLFKKLDGEQNGLCHVRSKSGWPTYLFWEIHVQGIVVKDWAFTQILSILFKGVVHLQDRSVFKASLLLPKLHDHIIIPTS